MLDFFEKVWPVLVATVCYIIRLEVTMAKIMKDLCWIKKRLERLQ